MITIEVNGVVYQGFISVQVENIFFAVSGGVIINATSQQGYAFPIKNQDNIRIFVNNTAVLNGFVDELTISYDAGTHLISMRARDITSDLIDSSLGSGINFNAPITLQQITNNILRYLGITKVNVSTPLSIAPYIASEIINPEVGENAFELIEKYARKRQVIATTDGNGNIIFMQSSKNPIATKLFNQVGVGGNIISASVTYASMARFNKYTCYSQGVGATEGENDSPDQGDISNFFGVATDSQVRSTRSYSFIAESASTTQECQKRATWEANWQRAQSFKYSCTIQGFVAQADGVIWRPNMLVNVQDEFANIASDLLVAKVTFNYDVGGASTTTLELVTEDSFTLEAEQPSRTVVAETKEEGPEYNNIDFEFYKPMNPAE